MCVGAVVYSSTLKLWSFMAQTDHTRAPQPCLCLCFALLSPIGPMFTHSRREGGPDSSPTWTSARATLQQWRRAHAEAAATRRAAHVGGMRRIFCSRRSSRRPRARSKSFCCARLLFVNSTWAPNFGSDNASECMCLGAALSGTTMLGSFMEQHDHTRAPQTCLSFCSAVLSPIDLVYFFPRDTAMAYTCIIWART